MVSGRAVLHRQARHQVHRNARVADTAARRRGEGHGGLPARDAQPGRGVVRAARVRAGARGAGGRDTRGDGRAGAATRAGDVQLRALPRHGRTRARQCRLPEAGGTAAGLPVCRASRVCRRRSPFRHHGTRGGRPERAGVEGAGGLLRRARRGLRARRRPGRRPGAGARGCRGRCRRPGGAGRRSTLEWREHRAGPSDRRPGHAGARCALVRGLPRTDGARPQPDLSLARRSVRGLSRAPARPVQAAATRRLAVRPHHASRGGAARAAAHPRCGGLLRLARAERWKRSERSRGAGAMRTGHSRIRRWLAGLAFVLLPVSACGDLPRDPEGSLERARGSVLRVGASGAPPWIARSSAVGPLVSGNADRSVEDPATGPEADLVRGFAHSIGSRVTWIWGPLDEHMERLQRFELDLVAAGLTEQTAWQGKVGLTTPWLEEAGWKRVLAVAPGENEPLTALERYI